MRRSTTTRAALLVAAALLLPAAGGIVGADAAVPSPLWIQQDGNGNGETKPMLTDYNVREVLFNGNRYPLPNGTTQRSYLKKYLAYGTVPQFAEPIPGQILAEVAMAPSDDGVTWDEDPRTITVRNPDGVDVPLIVNDPTDHFGVTFGSLPPTLTAGLPKPELFQFALYYRDHTAETHAFTDIHVAVSADSSLFELDQTVTQVGTSIVGPGESTFGPTQVMINPAGTTTCTADATFNPWTCRALMVIPVGSAAGEVLKLAGSGNGLSWRGYGTIIGTGTAGSWDDRFVSLGHVQKRAANEYVAYYSGADSTSANQCFGGESACFSLGVATSTDGLTWTKAAHNPVTPRSLYETALPGENASLWYPIPVAGKTTVCGVTTAQDQIFLSVIRGGGTGDPTITRDFWHALPAVPPTNAPSVRIDNPIGGEQPINDGGIEAYLTDTLGTNIGLDMSTLSIAFDAGPQVPGRQVTNSIVGALKFPSKKVVVPQAFSTLSEAAHSLAVSITDLDGVTGTGTVAFSMDRSAPETAMTTSSATPRIQLPLGSLGTYAGTTTDAVTQILGLRAIVTNPLGQIKGYEVREQCNVIGSRTNGFTVTQSQDGKTWTWSWVHPTFDLHALLPGPYTISVVGIDEHSTVEKPDAQNSASVLKIV